MYIYDHKKEDHKLDIRIDQCELYSLLCQEKIINNVLAACLSDLLRNKLNLYNTVSGTMPKKCTAFKGKGEKDTASIWYNSAT